MQLQMSEREAESKEIDEPTIYSNEEFQQNPLHPPSASKHRLKILAVIMLVVIVVLSVDLISQKTQQITQQITQEIDEPQKSGPQQRQQHNYDTLNKYSKKQQSEKQEERRDQPIIPHQKQQASEGQQSVAFFPPHCDCASFPDSIFHYFDYEQRKLFYLTRYNVLTQYCNRMGLQAYSQWFNQRQVIEWAYARISEGDKVLFDCQKSTNYEQMVVLSRLVGSRGQVHTTSAKENCLTLALTLNSAAVSSIGGTPPLSKYDAVVTTDYQYLRREVASSGLSNGPKKILVRVSLVNLNKENIFENAQVRKRYHINKIDLDSSDCESQLQISSKAEGEGYYELILKGYTQPVQQQPALPANNQLSKAQQQFQQFKDKLPSAADKKDMGSIGKDYPVSWQQLEGSAKAEWKQEVVVVEWAKNRTTKASTLFYELNPLNPNVYVILNLAAIVPQGKVYALCTEPQKCQKMAFQASSFSIGNLQLIEVPPTLSQTALIITNKLQTVSSHAKDNQLADNLILFYVSPDDSEQEDLLYWLYVRYRIRQVSIQSSYHFGYEIYHHFLWASQNPSGFFEIERSRYTIYQVWGGPLSQLSVNREYNFNQTVRYNTPQIKVITPTTRPYFILPDHPLHPAFPYLSLVHQADYMRTYMMRYYGGGYSDIKHVHFDYQPYFDRLFNGPSDKLAYGYHQVNSWDIACHEEPNEVSCGTIKKTPLKFMGNGYYIFKKDTPLVVSWMNRSNKILDQKYEQLKANPAQSPRDKEGAMIVVDGVNRRSKYPLRWAQILGQILVRAQYDNIGKYYLDFPYINPFDYQ